MAGAVAEEDRDVAIRIDVVQISVAIEITDSDDETDTLRWCDRGEITGAIAEKDRHSAGGSIAIGRDIRRAVVIEIARRDRRCVIAASPSIVIRRRAEISGAIA